MKIVYFVFFESFVSSSFKIGTFWNSWYSYCRREQVKHKCLVILVKMSTRRKITSQIGRLLWCHRERPGCDDLWIISCFSFFCSFVIIHFLLQPSLSIALILCSFHCVPTAFPKWQWDRSRRAPASQPWIWMVLAT